MLSRENAVVRETLKLKMKKYRDKEKKFIIEGVRFVEEGIKSGNIDYILYSKKLHDVSGGDQILESTFKRFEVSDDVMKEICDTENPQGVAAVALKCEPKLDGIDKSFIVIVDGVQDPGNMGTIIRTADAAGAGGIAVIKGSVDIYNSKTLRATMGSVFHIPFFFYDDFKSAAEEIKSWGCSIYASALEGKKNIYDCNFKGNTAVVIGNEGNGIPSEDLKYADCIMKIPMPGNAESLNAASASAVIIFEVVRQRLTT